MLTSLPYVFVSGLFTVEVGDTNDQRNGTVPVLSYIEARSHFGAWCIVSAPLILGFDLLNSTTVDSVWDIITNTEAIAVNQQWKGFSGSVCLQSNQTTHFDKCDWKDRPCDVPSWQVFYKPLSVPNLSTAVLVMNNGAEPLNIAVPFDAIPSVTCQECNIRDVWQHADLGRLRGGIPSHWISFTRLAFLHNHAVGKGS